MSENLVITTQELIYRDPQKESPTHLNVQNGAHSEEIKELIGQLSEQILGPESQALSDLKIFTDGDRIFLRYSETSQKKSSLHFRFLPGQADPASKDHAISGIARQILEFKGRTEDLPIEIEDEHAENNTAISEDLHNTNIPQSIPADTEKELPSSSRFIDIEGDWRAILDPQERIRELTEENSRLREDPAKIQELTKKLNNLVQEREQITREYAENDPPLSERSFSPISFSSIEEQEDTAAPDHEKDEEIQNLKQQLEALKKNADLSYTEYNRLMQEKEEQLEALKTELANDRSGADTIIQDREERIKELNNQLAILQNRLDADYYLVEQYIGARIAPLQTSNEKLSEELSKLHRLIDALQVALQTEKDPAAVKEKMQEIEKFLNSEVADTDWLHPLADEFQELKRQISVYEEIRLRQAKQLEGEFQEQGRLTDQIKLLNTHNRNLNEQLRQLQQEIKKLQNGHRNTQQTKKENEALRRQNEQLLMSAEDKPIQACKKLIQRKKADQFARQKLLQRVFSHWQEQALTQTIQRLEEEQIRDFQAKHNQKLLRSSLQTWKDHLQRKKARTTAKQPRDLLSVGQKEEIPPSISRKAASKKPSRAEMRKTAISYTDPGRGPKTAPRRADSTPNLQKKIANLPEIKIQDQDNLNTLIQLLEEEIMLSVKQVKVNVTIDSLGFLNWFEISTINIPGNILTQIQVFQNSSATNTLHSLVSTDKNLINKKTIEDIEQLINSFTQTGTHYTEIEKVLNPNSCQHSKIRKTTKSALGQLQIYNLIKHLLAIEISLKALQSGIDQLQSKKRKQLTSDPQTQKIENIKRAIRTKLEEIQNLKAGLKEKLQPTA